MITTAITAAITAVLNWLGIPPGPYVAGIWIAVKILMVTGFTLFGWSWLKKRKQQQATDAAKSDENPPA